MNWNFLKTSKVVIKLKQQEEKHYPKVEEEQNVQINYKIETIQKQIKVDDYKYS
ncbi:hypothetical protein RhiirA1_480132 [Rhizophagus irregularis]|uniref:Uncharacterized protein n=1 Tax=Rhizophagus irregularis TaxID=588596 RepID=A0A2N0QPS3_9GLOM|nr:hypothetical protein RhiirA1_480132 [Rhizophagus irregularis]